MYSRGQKNTPGLGDVGDPLRRFVVSTTMIRVSFNQALSKRALDGGPFRRTGVKIETKGPQRPPDGIGERIGLQRTRTATGEVHEQCRPNVAVPRDAATDRRQHRTAKMQRQRLHGVDRAENHLPGQAALLCERQTQLAILIVTEEPMRASGQADAVFLEAVPQTRLRDPPTGLDFVGQRHQIRDEVGIELWRETGCDSAEEHATDARPRVTGQQHVPERDPSRGCDRSRVEHLELCQQHSVIKRRSPATPTPRSASDHALERIPHPVSEIDDVLIFTVVGLEQLDQFFTPLAQR